jgi:hypothetical protein
MRPSYLRKKLQGLSEPEKRKAIAKMAEEQELAYWRAEGLRRWKEHPSTEFGELLVRARGLSIEDSPRTDLSRSG